MLSRFSDGTDEKLLGILDRELMSDQLVPL